MLRLLLAVALASAVLVPLTSVDAARSQTDGKSQGAKSQDSKSQNGKSEKDKAFASSTGSGHGQAKTSSADKTGAKSSNKSTAKSSNKSTAKSSNKPTTKKAQDETSTPNRGTIDPIGTVKRGQTVEVHATALRNGQMCALQIFYNDKAAKVIRDVTPDEKKRCTFTVTVPDRPGAVGVANARLILTAATSGKPSGEARQTFNVT